MSDPQDDVPMRSVSPDASATPGAGALKDSSAPPAELGDNVKDSQGDAAETSANEDHNSDNTKADKSVRIEEGADSPADTEATAAPPATPVPRKGSASASRRKSSGSTSASRGRRKSSRVLHLDAKPGEYYIARLKSYPPWPAIIADEDMLPPAMRETRPTTTKQADGTYHEMFQHNGKRVADRTFPIMFLATNEFAYIHNADLTPLDFSVCAEAQTKGKKKDLQDAYAIAAGQHDIDYYKNLLKEHERAREEELEEQAAIQAEKETKSAKKGKRKSSVVAEPDEDTAMESVNETPANGKNGTKRRKKVNETDVEDEKTPKTAKRTPKLKLSKPKTAADTEEEPSNATPAPRSRARRSSKAASKAKQDAAKESHGSEPESEPAPPEPEQQPVEEEDPVAKREKVIFFLRHRLQKGLLMRDQQPTNEEMPMLSQYIAKLESYEDLEVSIIRNTKIHKLLKAICKLPDIPREEEFNLKERSMTMLRNWKIPLAQADAGDDDRVKEETSEAGKDGTEKEESSEAGKEGTEKEESSEAGKEGTEKEEAPEAGKEGTEKAEAPEAAKEGTEKAEAPEAAKEGTEKAEAPEAAKEGTEKEEITLEGQKQDTEEQVGSETNGARLKDAVNNEVY